MTVKEPPRKPTNLGIYECDLVIEGQHFTKSDKFKYFWLEKGEHQEFRKRKKEFDQIWTEKVKQHKGKRVLSRKEVLKIYEELYRKSPWRIRDRFLIPTKHPPVVFNTGELYRKYVINNPYSATRKYYMRAMINLVKNDQQTGEQVAESELTLDRHGRVILQKGQSMILQGDKPGKSWKVFKNVEPIEMRAKRLFHDFSHQNYIENEGSELERQVYTMKTNKSLCWVEYLGLGNCFLNQGTSAWFCFDCVNFGELHPPVLPKYCPYLYTYKKWLCGAKTHSDANKQWHFSWEGEKVRDKIKGGDWGSCHIGTWSRPRKKSSRLKNKNWIIK